jgi:polar amino acid transport system substrate-binding protein
VIRVATDASYAPAAFFDRDGRTIIGFEPDLAAALGRVLGVELAFVRMDFRDALPALEAGEVDIIMAAMTDTPDRQEQVDFIDYFSAGTSILVQRGNPHGILDLDDLCGQTVAAEEGTIQVELLARVQADCGDRRILVRQFPDNDSALVELRTGRAAAVLNDYPPAARLTTQERTRADFQLASSVQYEPGFYGIAVPKDQTRLRDALREAMARIVRSGEYAQVLEKWGVSSGAVDQPLLNGGT